MLSMPTGPAASSPFLWGPHRGRFVRCRLNAQPARLVVPGSRSFSSTPPVLFNPEIDFQNLMLPRQGVDPDGEQASASIYTAPWTALSPFPATPIGPHSVYCDPDDLMRGISPGWPLTYRDMAASIVQHPRSPPEDVKKAQSMLDKLNQDWWVGIECQSYGCLHGYYKLQLTDNDVRLSLRSELRLREHVLLKLARTARNLWTKSLFFSSPHQDQWIPLFEEQAGRGSVVNGTRYHHDTRHRETDCARDTLYSACRLVHSPFYDDRLGYAIPVQTLIFSATSRRIHRTSTDLVMPQRDQIGIDELHYLLKHEWERQLLARKAPRQELNRDLNWLTAKRDRLGIPRNDPSFTAFRRRRLIQTAETHGCKVGGRDEEAVSGASESVGPPGDETQAEAAAAKMALTKSTREREQYLRTLEAYLRQLLADCQYNADVKHEQVKISNSRYMGEVYGYHTRACVKAQRSLARYLPRVIYDLLLDVLLRLDMLKPQSKAKLAKMEAQRKAFESAAMVHVGTIWAFMRRTNFRESGHYLTLLGSGDTEQYHAYQAARVESMFGAKMWEAFKALHGGRSLNMRVAINDRLYIQWGIPRKHLHELTMRCFTSARGDFQQDLSLDDDLLGVRKAWGKLVTSERKCRHVDSRIRKAIESLVDGDGEQRLGKLPLQYLKIASQTLKLFKRYNLEVNRAFERRWPRQWAILKKTVPEKYYSLAPELVRTRNMMDAVVQDEFKTPSLMRETLAAHIRHEIAKEMLQSWHDEEIYSRAKGEDFEKHKKKFDKMFRDKKEKNKQKVRQKTREQDERRREKDERRREKRAERMAREEDRYDQDWDREPRRRKPRHSRILGVSGGGGGGGRFSGKQEYKEDPNRPKSYHVYTGKDPNSIEARLYPLFGEFYGNRIFKECKNGSFKEMQWDHDMTPIDEILDSFDFEKEVGRLVDLQKGRPKSRWLRHDQTEVVRINRRRWERRIMRSPALQRSRPWRRSVRRSLRFGRFDGDWHSWRAWYRRQQRKKTLGIRAKGEGEETDNKSKGLPVPRNEARFPSRRPSKPISKRQSLKKPARPPTKSKRPERVPPYRSGIPFKPISTCRSPGVPEKFYLRKKDPQPISPDTKTPRHTIKPDPSSCTSQQLERPVATKATSTDRPEAT